MKAPSALESQSTSVVQEANRKPSKGPESFFRSQFKFYKRRDVDLSKVFDLRVSNPAIGVVCKPLEVSAISPSVQKRVHQYIDLRMVPVYLGSSSWLVCAQQYPHRNWSADVDAKMYKKYPEPPNVTNLSSLGEYKGEEVYKNCGTRLRWTTMGNDYNWSDKVYAEKPRESLPGEITELASIVCELLKLSKMNADAVVLNYYDSKSNLSPHVDRSERDMSKPLISVSLGQSAIYLTGGTEVSDPVDALYLHSGDVLVMNADQRSVYHALPRIITNKKFEDNVDADKCVIDFARTCRICVTIRQVD